MSESVPILPVFRKYPDNSSFFKIISLEEFEELKKMPEGYRRFQFIARIYPDKLLINDMINNFETFWLEIDEGEYYSVLNSIEIRK